MLNHWEAVVKEQLALMDDSGLYEASSRIIIGALGKVNELNRLRDLIADYPKIKMAYYSENLEEFEFPTLELLHKYCLNTTSPARSGHPLGEGDKQPPDTVFYIHTKGVFDTRGTHWRNYLNHYNITLWRDCVAKLEEGFDIVGVKFMHANHVFPQHFSGNFFHATCAHIAKLPSIEELRKEPVHKIGLRYNAEFWNGMGEPKWASLCQVIIDHKRTPEYK